MAICECGSYVLKPVVGIVFYGQDFHDVHSLHCGKIIILNRVLFCYAYRFYSVKNKKLKLLDSLRIDLIEEGRDLLPVERDQRDIIKKEYKAILADAEVMRKQ